MVKNSAANFHTHTHKKKSIQSCASLAGRGTLSQHLDTDTVNRALLSASSAVSANHRWLRQHRGACNKSALPPNLFSTPPTACTPPPPKTDTQNNSRSFSGAPALRASRPRRRGSKSGAGWLRTGHLLFISARCGAQKWTLFSCSHGPSGGTAGTVPSPNTIRKRGPVYPTVGGSDQREIMSGWV